LNNLKYKTKLYFELNNKKTNLYSEF